VDLWQNYGKKMTREKKVNHKSSPKAIIKRLSDSSCSKSLAIKRFLTSVGPKALVLLVRPAGFEPATYGFVVRHSIQLSYERALEEILLTQQFSMIN
jgi:hypothetical protein